VAQLLCQRVLQHTGCRFGCTLCQRHRQVAHVWIRTCLLIHCRSSCCCSACCKLDGQASLEGVACVPAEAVAAWPASLSHAEPVTVITKRHNGIMSACAREMAEITEAARNVFCGPANIQESACAAYAGCAHSKTMLPQATRWSSIKPATSNCCNTCCPVTGGIQVPICVTEQTGCMPQIQLTNEVTVEQSSAACSR